MADRTNGEPPLHLICSVAEGWAEEGRLHRSIRASFGTQIRMTSLPGRLTEALCLVDKLA